MGTMEQEYILLHSGVNNFYLPKVGRICTGWMLGVLLPASMVEAATKCASFLNSHNLFAQLNIQNYYPALVNKVDVWV